MHCPLHWLHCPSSASSLVNRFGARHASLAAGVRDPSPFSIAEARGSRTTVVFWTGDVQQTLMPTASPFRIVNRYLPLHVKVPSCGGSSPGEMFLLHFQCQPLLTVTYSSTSSQEQTVLTKMPWTKVTLPLDYRIRWDYISNRGRAQSGSSWPIQNVNKRGVWRPCV